MTAEEIRKWTCFVTGGSAGIGRAISLALAFAGATVCAVARRRSELEVTAERANGAGRIRPYAADVTVDRELTELARALRDQEGGVDVLVHSAGTYSSGPLETASVVDLDRQYATNARAPYRLTQCLLPSLRANAGQIVFINSIVTDSARAGVGQFAATQHALKAIADALREELKSDDVRVTSVFPGRTATARQAMIHAVEGKPYVPHRLLQPEDVAAVVLNALTMPRTAEVTDVRVRPHASP